MELIDRCGFAEAYNEIDKQFANVPDNEYRHIMKGARAMWNIILKAPTIEAEPNYEQIEEYCRKRCLVVVDSGLFNEMKLRWSSEPVKHAHVVTDEDGNMWCSNCGSSNCFDNYCGSCGAKLREVEV